jgi:hypothetical protein
MDSSRTLQDFVLNLIYDPAARSAFELDPEACLQHNGLGDITAIDVQQVIPLVIDSVPVSGLTGLVDTDDLTTGVANLDVAGAVAQLQTITAQVTAPVHGIGDLSTTVTAVSSTVVGVTGDNLLSGSVLSGSALGLNGLSDIPVVGGVDLGWLSGASDPGLSVDSGVVASVDGAVTDVVPDAGHLLPATNVGAVGTLDIGVNTVTSLPSSIDLPHSSGLDVAGVHEATSSIVGSVIRPDLGADLTHDPVHTVQGTVSDAGHGVTDTLHSVTHTTEDASGHDLLGGIAGLHL